MKRFVRDLTAVLMAVVMFMCSSIGVFAAQDSYISDIKIGYGEEGRKALAAAGYNVWNIDANKGGIYTERDEDGKETDYGNAVYIGYKTTMVKEDAITDIGVMNMTGNYSFSDWADEVKSAWEEAARKVDRFQAAIGLFRENYRKAVEEKEAGSEELSFPELAYQMMNYYYEDDTAQNVGDLFLNEDTTDLQLETVFMQGNASILRTIEYSLALGCVEADGDTFLSRLAEADVYASLEEDEEDEEDDPLAGENGQALDESIVPLNQACGIIIDAISYTKDTVSEYRQRLSDMKNYAGEEDYLNSLDDQNKASYTFSKQVYSILEKTPYGNLEGVTLLDIIDLSETTRNELGLVLNSEAVAPLARCMTAAQIGLLEFIGLDNLLIMTDSVMDEESAEAYRSSVQAKLEEIAEEYEGKTASVYYGVDRSLFTDVENIALTGEAVKNRVFAEGTAFGLREETRNTVATALGPVIILSCVGFLAFGAAASAWLHGDIALALGTKLVVSIGTIACFVGAIVAFVLFLKYIEKPVIEYEDVSYTKIPRVLVDIKLTTNTLNKREEKHYIPYYAAYNIQAAEGETNTTKLFGDLNGLSGKAQWLVLYYTKDELAGTPLKAGDLLVKEGSAFSTTELTGYRAIHVLGNSNPENLNQYHVNDADVLFAAVPVMKTSGGSIFTDSSLWNVVAGVGLFAVGGVVAMLLTSAYYKKKKKAAEN